MINQLKKTTFLLIISNQSNAVVLEEYSVLSENIPYIIRYEYAKNSGSLTPNGGGILAHPGPFLYVYQRDGSDFIYQLVSMDVDSCQQTILATKWDGSEIEYILIEQIPDFYTAVKSANYNPKGFYFYFRGGNLNNIQLQYSHTGRHYIADRIYTSEQRYEKPRQYHLSTPYENVNVWRESLQKYLSWNPNILKTIHLTSGSK